MDVTEADKPTTQPIQLKRLGSSPGRVARVVDVNLQDPDEVITNQGKFLARDELHAHILVFGLGHMTGNAVPANLITVFTSHVTLINIVTFHAPLGK